MTRLFILLLSLFSTLASAQPWELRHEYPLESPYQVKYNKLPDALLFFCPSGVTKDLDEVLAGNIPFIEKPSTVELVTDKISWLKVDLVNAEASETRFLFELGSFRATWSAIDVYVIAEDTIEQSLRLGNNVQPKDKAIRNAKNLFWLSFGVGEQKTVLFKLRSKVNGPQSGINLKILDRKSVQDFEGLEFQYFSNPLILHQDARHFQLRNSLEYILAPNRDFTFAEVKEEWDTHARFYRPEDYYPSRKSTLWCRFKIINITDVAQSHLFDAGGDAPYIEVYLPGEQGKYRMVKTGKKIGKEEKVIPHTLSLVNYSIAPNDTAFIFIKYAAFNKDRLFLTSIHDTGILFFEPTDLMTKTRRASLWKGFFLGIFLFQLLYFVLRSLLENDALGLYYASVILGFLLLFIFLENTENTFVALQIFYFENHLLLFFAIIILSLGLHGFTNKYLQLKQNLPQFYQLQRFLLVIIILLQVFLYLQTEWDHGAARSSFFTVNFGDNMLIAFGLLLLSCIVAAIVSYFRKTPYALYYLIAFSPFILVTLFIVFRYVWVYFGVEFWFSTMYWSFILTSILFAIVTAKRNNELKSKEVYANNLIKLDKVKSKFYSNITHEFRTPLTVIMGLANSLKGNTKEKELIQKNSQEVLDLVQQLLEISKAQSGLLQLKLVDDNIVLYLEYLIESFYTLADQKNIDLRFHCEEEEIIMAYDKEKIKFILSNLISNAIKFTPHRGKVFVKAHKDKGVLALSVRDTGIGLSKEEEHQVFDRFYQAPNQHDVDQQGTGIGLSLVKELVEILEGSITVDSVKSKGTTFRVHLPLQQLGLRPTVNNMGDEQNQVVAKPNFISSENESIALVVEDNMDVLFYIEKILVPNYKVLKAYDGQEGFEIATDVLPDIIISDVMMPKMDGYTLTEKLKEDTRTNHIPIILLTAKAGQAEKIKGLADGADAYLTKPFHEEELKVRMNKLILSRLKLREAFAKQEQLAEVVEKQDPFITSALAILEQQYADEDFGIKELGQALHLSRMQVHRKLKALTNYSTSQFINYFRLERGKVLLEDESLNISEVSYSCGFSDPGYFSKLFSKQYGLSPLAYRGKNLHPD